ncbi:MAG TPA: hypothetical protein VMX56_04370 [Anaerolineales bacterium]|nr:hypothetical protein [Anaerolineales bacterium]
MSYNPNILTQRDRRFAAALLDRMARWQQDSMEAWSTQRLQDAIDALNMDVDGEYVDLAIHAAIAADDAMAEGGGG